MIKHIINIIKTWFTPKTEIDPHEELMLHVPEPEVPLYMEDGKYLKCGTHNRYKKSCPVCREVAGVA